MAYVPTGEDEPERGVSPPKLSRRIDEALQAFHRVQETEEDNQRCLVLGT